jgi:bifunctional non-homologous end joining protein LigD
MSLKEYARKRDFRKTAEPKARRAPDGSARRFVIQKHAASRLHYDFRLELGGTLKSWAVPKGPPYRKGERRLAVQVEDHPVDYINFEGTIPQGQYGGGTVMVWDQGTFEPLSDDPLAELDRGKLHFVLHGTKLAGEWYLVQLRGGKDWLLIKGGENMKPVSARADDTSAVSGRSMAAIAKGNKVWGASPEDAPEPDEGVASPGPATDRSRNRSHSREPAERDEGVVPPKARRGKRAAVGRELARAERDEGIASPKPTTHRSRTRSLSRKPAARDEDLASPDSSRSGRARVRARPVGTDPAVAAPVGRELARANSRPRSTSPGKSAARSASHRVSFTEPMKALLVEQPPSGEWLYEIKLDGFRALALRDANGTRLLSRNNKDLAGRFPEIAAAIGQLDCSSAALDGEIVALDEQGRSSFQLLQANDLGTERPPILYYVFDVLSIDGRDLRALPLTARRAELQQLLDGVEGPIRFSATLGTEPEPLLAEARKLGLEGLIGKRPESRYEPGQRSGAWIKLKLHHEQEFVIGGYTPPGGSRQHFGALLVGVYEGDALKFSGKVGTGFNAKLLRELHARFEAIASPTCPFVNLPDRRTSGRGQGVTAAEMRRCHWVEPKLVCQLKFAEWTRDDRLRQPVFLGLREDKSAKEVVREQR